MITRKFLYFIFATFVFLSCTNYSNNEKYQLINDWIGKEIHLLSDKKNEKLNKHKDDLKIVTRINGDCSSCILELTKWDDVIKDINENHKVTFFIYIATTDSLVFKKINEKFIKFKHYVVLDKNNEFIQKNNLPKNSIFHTMLLNKYNEILLMGNPVESMDLQELYIEVIKKYNTRSHEKIQQL